MLRDEMQTALTLTRKMHEAFQGGELDQVEQLAQQRDVILRQCLGDPKTRVHNQELVSDIVEQIVGLNDEMIVLGQKEKDEMKRSMEKEVRGSTNVKKYLDNME